MFEEMTKFFGCDPDSPFLFRYDDYIFIVVSKKGMTEVPELNDQFRIGPYVFKCINVTENHVGGYIRTPTL